METEQILTKKRKKAVLLPVKKDFILQSNRVTDAVYDFSVIQERIFNTIIFNLQSAIKLSFDNKDYGQLSLWKNLNNSRVVTLKIPLKVICTPQNYDKAKKAIEELSSIPVKIPFIDDNNKELYFVGTLFNAYLSKVNDYSSYVDISIDKEAAKWLIEIQKDNHGKPIHWTYFMYQIAQSAKNKYTAKIYKKLCSWRDKGAFRISLDEFRKWLCIDEKYKDFSDIKARILIPVQNELTNKADLWFNCNAKDFITRQGNKVTYLNFKIIKPDLIEAESKLKDQVFYLLRTHFKFENRHIDQIRPIFDNATPSKVLEKLNDLYQYYMNNISNIADITGYAIKSLLNEFCAERLF